MQPLCLHAYDKDCEFIGLPLGDEFSDDCESGVGGWLPDEMCVL